MTMQFGISFAKLLLILGGLVACTVPASAADMALKAPAPPAASLWNGWYAGGNIGGGWGRRDIASLSSNDFVADEFFNGNAGPGPAPSMRLNPSGLVGGLQLGYNWRIHQKWLVGVETDFEGSGAKGSTSVLSGPAFLTAIYSFDTQLNWFGTIRGRVGWLPSDNLLIYGTGGFAYGSVTTRGNVTSSDTYGSAGIPFVGVPTTFACGPADPGFGSVNPCFAGSSSSRLRTGWAAGTGFEWAFMQNWSLKGEYLLVDLQGDSFTESALGQCVPCGGVGFAPASFNVSLGHSIFNIVHIGLNRHF